MSLEEKDFEGTRAPRGDWRCRACGDPLGYCMFCVAKHAGIHAATLANGSNHNRAWVLCRAHMEAALVQYIVIHGERGR